MSKKHKEHLDAVNRNDQLNRAHEKDFLKSIKAPFEYKKELRDIRKKEKEARYAEAGAAADQAWKALVEDAKKVLREGPRGYETPMAVIMEILHSEPLITSVLYHELFAHNRLAHLFLTGVRLASDAALGEAKLPKIEYFVDMHDDNTLNIKSLDMVNRNWLGTNPQQELTQEQVFAFQALIVKFLGTKGYEPDEEHPGKFFKSKEGTESKVELKKDVFESISEEMDVYIAQRLEPEVPVSRMKP